MASFEFGAALDRESKLSSNSFIADKSAYPKFGFTTSKTVSDSQAASGKLLSKQSNSQEKATAEQVGITAVADRSRKNKLRLAGITWCVFSALKYMVKPA